MNMSQAVSSLITELGLFNITLPFVDNITKEPIPIENVIQDTLEKTTIPIYSQYVPWIRKGDCDVKNLKVVDDKNAIYMLPSFLTMTPIMYVIAVTLPFHNSRGTYGDIAPSYGISRSVQGVLSAQSYMMVAGQMRNEPTWDYLGHNQIQLFGYPKTILTFKVACKHLENGESIEEGCYSSFMELATLDVKRRIYNTLKYYKTIPTAHGNLDLNIDDFASASQDRTALLKEWDDRFHLDMDLEEFM